MPKYFCEYCGIYLTHSSPGGRKQHSHGRKHINNKIEYYSQFLYEFQQQNTNKGVMHHNPIQMPTNPHGGGLPSHIQKFMVPVGSIRAHHNENP